MPVPDPDNWAVGPRAVGRFEGADGLLLLAVGIWGLNVSVVKFILGRFQPLELSVLRFTVGAGIFFLIVRLREGDMRVPRRDWVLLVAAAIVGVTFNQATFVYSLRFTTATNLSLLLTSTPVWAALAVWVGGMEWVGTRHWHGIVISMVGVGAIIVFRPGGVGVWFHLLGDILALATAVSWAAYSVLIRPLVQRHSVFKVSAWVLLLGSLALLPLGVPQFQGHVLATLPPLYWAGYAYSLLAAVVLTNAFWFAGIRRLGAARGTVYANIQPFIGVFFAGLLLHERISPLQLLGGLIVVAGVVYGRSIARAASARTDAKEPSPGQLL